MQKPHKQSKKKLLVSVDKLRPLDSGQLQHIVGGACPKSRPVDD